MLRPRHPAHKGIRLTLLALIIGLLLPVSTAQPALAAAALVPVPVQLISSGPLGGRPSDFVEVNGTIIYLAGGVGAGYALWKSDGTGTGTVLVKQLRSSEEINSSSLLGTLGNTVFFRFDGQLWGSDGTPEGTTFLADIWPSLNSPAPQYKPVNVAEFAGSFYFAGRANGQATGLWRSDGTPEGTFPVRYADDDYYVPTELKVVGDSLYFAVEDSRNEDDWSPPRFALYRSDGTTAERLFEAFDLPIDELNAVGNTLLFRAPRSRVENGLWRSDGTPKGTVPVQIGGIDSNIYSLITFRNTLLFASENGLWRSDGTTKGSKKVKQLRPDGELAAISNLVVLGNLVYFTADDDSGSAEPWRSDGSSGGTFQLAQIGNKQISSAGDFLLASGKIYFSAYEGAFDEETRSYIPTLWETDGTTANTRRAVALTPGSGIPTFERLLWELNGELFVVGSLFSNGEAIWKLAAQPLGRATDGLLALYDFAEGRGRTIRDSAGAGAALNLTIQRATNYRWVDGGLELKGGTVLASNGPARKLIDAAKAHQALSIEVWITPADLGLAQYSARIVTISPNETVRNLTLTQGSFSRQASTEAILRLRSSTVAGSGTEFSSGDGVLQSGRLAHLVVTIAPDNSVRFYVDGGVIESGSFTGDFATWRDHYRLLLGNELGGGRGWKGTYYLAAFYDRALDDSEVLQNYVAGP